MKTSNRVGVVVLLAVSLLGLPRAWGADPELTDSQALVAEAVEKHEEVILETNRAIWEFAEVGLQEHQSAGLLIEHLEENGFRVTEGVAGMPTAFVAEYGSGQPVIGILAEYDALPDLSQAAVPYREVYKEGEAGHACGHSGLGAGALGAALAVRDTLNARDLTGTIRLYGTPAEETLIGKVYMQLAGVFDDLDVCLHWHPGTKNSIFGPDSTKAMVSAKFTFHGLNAHASSSPEDGRSALDAVELMNVGVNYLREHVTEDARIHYIITNGGGAPNIVPPEAQVWYYVRADAHEDVERYFERVQEIARGAAMMTRTDVEMQIDTDCHEMVENEPLADLLLENMKAVGAPRFNDEERAFARRCQQPLIDEFGTSFPVALDEEIHAPTPSRSKGSTDVGDISWHVPTGGLRTTCFAADAPGHSWQNVACIRSSIGEKGIVYAAKVLAVTAVDLFEQPALVEEAKRDWENRMKGRTYTTLIPEGQEAPKSIR